MRNKYLTDDRNNSMNSAESACARFAGGFVPVDTEVIVVIARSSNNDSVTVTTRAENAPSSPKEAVVGIADAYGIDVDDVRATVYVLVGGADGDKI